MHIPQARCRTNKIVWLRPDDITLHLYQYIFGAVIYQCANILFSTLLESAEHLYMGCVNSIHACFKPPRPINGQKFWSLDRGDENHTKSHVMLIVYILSREQDLHSLNLYCIGWVLNAFCIHPQHVQNVNRAHAVVPSIMQNSYRNTAWVLCIQTSFSRHILWITEVVFSHP